MSTLEQLLRDQLDARQSAGNKRTLKQLPEPVDFFSNDYLGLASSGRLGKMILDSYSQTGGTGSTGSRLLSGNSTFAEDLESRIAGFHKAEAALLFNSGYDANLGLISAIGLKHTTIIYDELCHASIIDGIRLTITPRKFKYRHNDIADLSEMLLRHRDSGALIVITESVFSMDGDTAPLELIAALCELCNAHLIVDEAHATGVIGQHGEGLVVALDLQEKVFARVHTYGKAMGCHGASVVGSTLLREYLINYARSFIYTTALPAHSLYAIACAYDHLSGPEYNAPALHERIGYFRDRVARRQIEGLIESTSAIQAFVTGGNERTRQLAETVRNAGIRVAPILSPTVPAGSERLRICLHAFNTEAEIDKLLDLLQEFDK